MKIQVAVIATIISAVAGGKAMAVVPAAPLYNGNLCIPVLSDAGVVERDVYGVHNVSATQEATVWCPIQTPGQISGNLCAVVYDRNASVGVDVSCTLYDLGPDGSTQWQVNRKSSGSGSAAQTLDFGYLNPIGTNMVMQCSIPRLTSGYSHVTSWYWSNGSGCL